MLQLNKEARAFLDGAFGSERLPRSQWDKGTNQRYDAIERAYTQLIRIVVYVNQEAIALNLLTEDDKTNLISAISRIYESQFWMQMSFASNLSTPDDDSLEWLLINDEASDGCGILAESYKLVSLRLLKLAPHATPLENALIRLMNSYHLSGQVCDRAIKAIKRERSIVLQDHNADHLPIAQPKAKRKPKPFRVSYRKNQGKGNVIRRVVNATKFF